MLSASQKPSYTCWRCLIRSSQRVRVPVSKRVLYSTSSTEPIATPEGWTDHSHGTAQSRSATIPTSYSLPESPSKPLTTREQLRALAYEMKHGQRDSLFGPEPPLHRAVMNKNEGSQSSDSLEVEASPDPDFWTIGGMGNATEDEVWTVGSNTRYPGDLVELRAASARSSTLAIYIGFFTNHHHFYTFRGRWLMSPGYPASFSVSAFATAEELEPVLAAIPAGLSIEAYRELQQDDQGPTREHGSKLLEKMLAFKQESERIRLNNVGSLESADSALCGDDEVKHLNLFEIAQILLPDSAQSDGTYAASALYAVLGALQREDVAFRPLSSSRDCHRRDYLFEILPKSQLNVISSISNMVRAMVQLAAKSGGRVNSGYLTTTPMGAFLVQARDVVRKSREIREWTPHGILQPSKGLALPRPTWSETSQRILSFLEWWASHGIFDSGSSYHGTGASILRQLDLYEDAILDQSTAWTFLQEVGHVAPWEIPSRFRIHLPGTQHIKGGGISRDEKGIKTLKKSLRTDIAAEARSATGDATVFCIDDPGTTLIDDGISLEHTEEANEYWIHVHAADPASQIKPTSALSDFLELVPDNVYLQGHFQAMLPSATLANDKQQSTDHATDGLAAAFSLSPGKPALTFSAKVTSAGDILDYKVEPRIVTNVKNLDPVDVARFCGQSSPQGRSTDIELVVGNLARQPSENARQMAKAQDLERSAQEDLHILHRLAEALKGRRLEKGAWPHFPPRPSVSVEFNELPTGDEDMRGTDCEPLCMKLPADPQIQVKFADSTGCSVVANLMVLAGQVAAKWHSERGIPGPFRRNTHGDRNYDQALAYVRKEILPLFRKRIDPSRQQRNTLSAMIGGVELATKPGSYFILGLESYMKVTSPLRRFADLISHWQIHAVLAHERKVGRQIDPAKDSLDDILPFPESQLAPKLMLLEMREEMIRRIAHGEMDWIYIALARAWRYEGGVPEKMRFTATQSWYDGLTGTLDYFDLEVDLHVVDMNGLVLLKDVKAGDQFEVEISDINVHSRTISVKALSYLGSDAPPASGLAAGGSMLTLKQNFGLGQMAAKSEGVNAAESSAI